MTDNDPFILLTKPDTEWPPGVDYPVSDAVKRFDPAAPSPLVRLLRSSDPMVSRRGLRVFGDLGRKGAVLLDDALKLIRHPDDTARNALMDGIICYPESLTSKQARAVLQLANDPFSLVREKVAVFLAHADLQSLDCAIRSLAEPLLSQHREGLELLIADHLKPQQLFDEAVARRVIWSTYAFASLERMARVDKKTFELEYAGDDYVGKAVVAHVKMVIARRHRTQSN